VKLKKAQKVRDFFAQGDITLQQASRMRPSAMLVCGRHSTRDLLKEARWLVETFPELPLIFSGGIGRGTRLLERAIRAYILLRGRPELTKKELESEASMMMRLFLDEGLGRQGLLRLEPRAEHTGHNWRYSVDIFKEMNLPEDAIIFCTQAECNRLRAGVTGRRIMRENGYPNVRVLTLHLPGVPLAELGERDQAIELYRTFGMAASPASELRVCEECEPGVLAGMPPALREIAGETERGWHEWLERNPRYMDHFVDALLNTPASVGGRGALNL
jgi:hypothetical protein